MSRAFVGAFLFWDSLTSTRPLEGDSGSQTGELKSTTEQEVEGEKEGEGASAAPAPASQPPPALADDGGGDDYSDDGYDDGEFDVDG